MLGLQHTNFEGDIIQSITISISTSELHIFWVNLRMILIPVLELIAQYFVAVSRLYFFIGIYICHICLDSE